MKEMGNKPEKKGTKTMLREIKTDVPSDVKAGDLVWAPNGAGLTVLEVKDNELHLHGMSTSNRWHPRSTCRFYRRKDERVIRGTNGQMYIENEN